MNKQIFLVLSMLCVINVSGSLRLRSSREKDDLFVPLLLNPSKRRSSKKSFQIYNSVQQYNLNIPDRKGENEVTLVFPKRYVAMDYIFTILAAKLNCNLERVRLRIGKNCYKQGKEIDLEKVWFEEHRDEHCVNISELNKFIRCYPNKVYYSKKRIKEKMTYNGQKISYKRKNNDKIDKTIITFDLKNSNFSEKSIDDLKDIFKLEQRIDTDYEQYDFKIKNKENIKTDIKNSNNLNFKNNSELQFIFPDINSGITYIKNILTFENNFISVIKIEDTDEILEVNETMDKKDLIKFLNLLKKRESI